MDAQARYPCGMHASRAVHEAAASMSVQAHVGGATGGPAHYSSAAILLPESTSQPTFTALAWQAQPGTFRPAPALVPSTAPSAIRTFMRRICCRLSKAQPQLCHRRKALPLCSTHKPSGHPGRRPCCCCAAAALCPLSLPRRHRRLGCSQAGHSARHCTCCPCQRSLPVDWVNRCCCRRLCGCCCVIVAAVVSAVCCCCCCRGRAHTLCIAGLWVARMSLQHRLDCGSVIGPLLSERQAYRASGPGTTRAGASSMHRAGPRHTVGGNTRLR